MFNQWFFFMCSLVFVRQGGNELALRPAQIQQPSRDISTCVSVDNQYGWQVSANAVSVFEIAAK